MPADLVPNDWSRFRWGRHYCLAAPGTVNAVDYDGAVSERSHEIDRHLFRRPCRHRFHRAPDGVLPHRTRGTRQHRDRAAGARHREQPRRLREQCSLRRGTSRPPGSPLTGRISPDRDRHPISRYRAHPRLDTRRSRRPRATLRDGRHRDRQRGYLGRTVLERSTALDSARRLSVWTPFRPSRRPDRRPPTACTSASPLAPSPAPPTPRDPTFSQAPDDSASSTRRSADGAGASSGTANRGREARRPVPSASPPARSRCGPDARSPRSCPPAGAFAGR